MWSMGHSLHPTAESLGEQAMSWKCHLACLRHVNSEPNPYEYLIALLFRIAFL